LDLLALRNTPEVAITDPN